MINGCTETLPPKEPQEETLQIQETPAASPLKMDISLSKAPALGETAEIIATIQYIVEIKENMSVPKTVANIILPEGFELTSGDPTWEGYVKNEPQQFSILVKAVEVGDWTIQARARSPPTDTGEGYIGGGDNIYVSVLEDKGIISEKSFPKPKEEGSDRAVQIQPGRSYQSVSFSELEMNPSIWNGKYITIYGFYEKNSNLFKESKTAKFGLNIAIAPDLNTGWLSIDGLFSYNDSYNLEVYDTRTGKNAGSRCLNNNECHSNLCLLCPGMKMILAGHITYEDLPENAIKIDFSVTESGIVSEIHKGSIILINPAPNYGYCAGGVLPTSGPYTQEYIDKVHQAYIDNNILESDEPFVWGPKTSADDGGSGYCIGIRNNNKYKWVPAKSGDVGPIIVTPEPIFEE